MLRLIFQKDSSFLQMVLGFAPKFQDTVAVIFHIVNRQLQIGCFSTLPSQIPLDLPDRMA